MVKESLNILWTFPCQLLQIPILKDKPENLVSDENFSIKLVSARFLSVVRISVVLISNKFVL